MQRSEGNGLRAIGYIMRNFLRGALRYWNEESLRFFLSLSWMDGAVCLYHAPAKAGVDFLIFILSFLAGFLNMITDTSTFFFKTAIHLMRRNGLFRHSDMDCRSFKSDMLNIFRLRYEFTS